MNIWSWGSTDENNNPFLKSMVSNSIDSLNLDDIQGGGENIKKQLINLNEFLNVIYKVELLGGSYENKVDIISNLRDENGQKFISKGNSKQLLELMKNIINPEDSNSQKGGAEVSSPVIPAKFVSDSAVKTIDSLKKSHSEENNKDGEGKEGDGKSDSNAPFNKSSSIQDILEDFMEKIKKFRDNPDLIEFFMYVLNNIPFVNWIYNDFILSIYSLSKNLYVESSLIILKWYNDFFKIINDLKTNGNQLFSSLSNKIKDSGKEANKGFKGFIYSLIGDTCPKPSNKSIHLQPITIKDKTFLKDVSNHLFTNDIKNPVFLGKWNPKLDKIFWHPSRINEINLTKK